MTISPMRVHKNIVIRRLLTHPDELRDYLPEWPGTAREAAVALINAPGEYTDEVEIKFVQEVAT